MGRHDRRAVGEDWRGRLPGNPVREPSVCRTWPEGTSALQKFLDGTWWRVINTRWLPGHLLPEVAPLMTWTSRRGLLPARWTSPALSARVPRTPSIKPARVRPSSLVSVPPAHSQSLRKPAGVSRPAARQPGSLFPRRTPATALSRGAPKLAGSAVLSAVARGRDSLRGVSGDGSRKGREVVRPCRT